MTIVQLVCVNCEKLSEVEGVEYLQMKKEGLIVDTSYKGRIKRHECCQKKAPSRGKKSKGKTPTNPKKPTKTTDDRQQKSSAAASKIVAESLAKALGKNQVDIPIIEGRFPKTLEIDGKVFDYLIYSKYAKQAVDELIKIHKVDARVVQSGEFKPIYGVYVDKAKFKYASVHVRGSGYVIVYKDWDKPPKKVKFATDKSGSKTVTRLMRVRGTIREINRQLSEKHPDINRYYKSKVFGLHGRYLVKTYDIFIDGGSTKPPKPRGLSKDYKKWCEEHSDQLISDPHCTDCSVESCENYGMGDDACPSGFRS